MISPQNIRPNTVTVLIGPNGSGKSRLLRQVCQEFLQKRESVIAIAPTIFDRFEFRPRKHFKFLGARQGRGAAVRVVREALLRTWSQNPLVLKNLTMALKYTRFDPFVGLGVFNLNLDNFASVGNQLPRDEAETLHSALLRLESTRLRDSVIRLGLDSHSLTELENLSFTILVKHERLLRKARVAAPLEYYFYRDSRAIPILQACSGELWFIITIAFISTEILQRSVIAIDEPDTSLHPTWQRDYVRTLLDLFHRYEPRILIIETLGSLPQFQGYLVSEEYKPWVRVNIVPHKDRKAGTNLSKGE